MSDLKQYRKTIKDGKERCSLDTILTVPIFFPAQAQERMKRHWNGS